MTPLPHQQAPIAVLSAALAHNRSCLDASDTGVGKTFHALLSAKASQRTVAVVCPKSVVGTWAKLIKEAGLTSLFVANIERLKADQQWLTGDGRRWRWQLPVGTVLIIDEVHRFAGSTTENGFILANAPPPVLMLSATCASDPTKMRAIAHQLRLARWEDWWSWCGRNGCKRGHFGGLVFKGKAEHLDKIHRSIFTTGLGVRVRIAEIPDFPENFIETVLVPVENQHAVNQAYEKELQALETSAQNQAVEILRARQISEHGKLEATLELILDTIAEGRSAAVFVNFRESLAYLGGKLKCPTVYGQQDPGERARGVADFVADKARAIVCMIQAGGESIGLADWNGTFPRTQFIFPGWSARELIQAFGRCPRVGAKSAVITKIVIADETHEVRIKQQIDHKLTNHRLINDGLTDDDLVLKELKR